MHTPHSPTGRSPAASAATRLAKAVGSLLVLAGAVAGLPLLLAWATPIIWATSHQDLVHLLDRQDTGSVFLLLLIAVGWLGWAQFTLCAAREFLAQLRGRTWRAPRGLGASQRAAAALIGSILVLLPADSALASPAHAAPTASATAVPGQPQPVQAGQPSQETPAATDTAQNRSTYTVREVRPAESLWSIAAQQLGDGEQWREIAELNEGRTMGDGSRFHASSFLQPGWTLQMPQTAAGAAAGTAAGPRTQLEQATAASEDGTHRVTVKTGDSLSKIAQEELGDSGQWPHLFEASRDTQQPDGLPRISDPDVIYAGQQVTVPGPASAKDDPPQEDSRARDSEGQPTAPPADQDPQDTQEQHDEQGGGRADERAPAPAPSRSTTPPADEPRSMPSQTSRSADQDHEHGQEQHAAPPVAPGAGTGTSRPAAPSASDTASPAAATSQAPGEQPANDLPVRTVLGAGALLAAAITGALALRRLLQRRRRKPGQMIAIAPETAPAEAQLAAAAEPDAAARLDRALRTLAHRAAHDGRETVPGLRAARISAHTLQVLADEAAQEPWPPFTAGEDGWWLLPADADLLTEDQAREVPAPYPGLVTLGSTTSGDLLLTDLAQLPALLLDGEAAHITEVCTSLALELGMSPWAQDVEVITVGFGEALPHLLPTCRIAHIRQAEHALRDLSERLLEAQQMPESTRQPYLLLCAARLEADTAWQLADLIDTARRAGRVPVTLIAPATSTAAHFPQAEVLNASSTTPQQVEVLETEIVLQRLERSAYQQIAAALAMSGQPPEDAEGPWRAVPAEPDHTGHTEPPPAQHDTDDAGRQAAPPGTAADNSVTTGPAKPSSPASSDPGDNSVITGPTTAPTSPTSANHEGDHMFPALMAASADPSALRLLPAEPDPGQADNAPRATDRPASEARTAPRAVASKAGVSKPEPETDADTSAEEPAHDLHAPEIRVLGPLEVDRIGTAGHGPRLAQLATLLYFRPGRLADQVCADMDPLSPWSVATLNSRLRGLRRVLGNDPSGAPYVPRRRSLDDPYLLSPTVRCDWNRFRQLAERGLANGPDGLPDLEKALGLVRGRPFGTQPLPWAEPYQQEMITRIVDVANTVATHRLPPGPHHDLSRARHAVATGLEVDEGAELLYRAWMRIEWTAGNRSGLHAAISRVQQVNRALNCDLETKTECLINTLLNGNHRTQVPADSARP
ncbi:LysM peptidoglycan-binding domain-containing protein [Streptomyces minutiscleroticus]|uniref:LysM peptidoglycan-binding domain-containing protein n=1 Tax=Streptomyces minutiscleroticus TaxID=68238 RepID=UPI003333B507